MGCGLWWWLRGRLPGGRRTRGRCVGVVGSAVSSDPVVKGCNVYIRTKVLKSCMGNFDYAFISPAGCWMLHIDVCISIIV